MIRSFNGKKPRIAETAYVSEFAYIIGDVGIGENSSVWPGAVIRGDLGKIIIGENSAVEDNCVLHAGSPESSTPDIMSIGNNVHIGHGAVVNCRRIGNHVLIGMNTTILHDAEIGDFCIIGASSMVSQEMKIPDKSFVVGIPARIKGEVTPKQLWWVEQAPKGYVQLAKQYKKEHD
ncbi:gamma carbonic anhydrase family protein [Thermodesulfobacteriota bacterium]